MDPRLCSDSFSVADLLSSFASFQHFDSFVTASLQILKREYASATDDEHYQTSSLQHARSAAESAYTMQGDSSASTDVLADIAELKSRVLASRERAQRLQNIYRLSVLVRDNLITLGTYLRRLPTLAAFSTALGYGDFERLLEWATAIGRTQQALFSGDPAITKLSSLDSQRRTVQNLHEQAVHMVQTHECATDETRRSLENILEALTGQPNRIDGSTKS